MLTFLRAIKFAAQNFVRNFWLSLVTVIILALSIFFISVLVGVRVTAEQALSEVRSRVDVSVFFQADAPESDMLELQAKLERLPEVASVTYVSKDDALAKFREQTQGEEGIERVIEAIGVNPLQASLVIRAKQLEHYQQILAVVTDPAYDRLIEKDHVADSKITFIQAFSQFTKNLSRFGVWLSVVFSIIAALVVFNTIRITIYAYRTEISIMKLVGASNAFVRAPFIIESVFYALIAALVALVVLWLLIASLAPFLTRLFAGFDLDVTQYLQTNFFAVFGPPVLLAVVLSMFSSGIAVGRYLRI